MQRVGRRTGAALVPEVEREAGAELEDFPSRFHRSLYGKSDDPEHAENRNSREFLDGYAEGLTFDKANGLDAISDEWERRGSLDDPGAGFREWKRGYNAASLRRSWEGEGRKRNDSEPGHSPTDQAQRGDEAKPRV